MQSVGVQRQYSGTARKVENCQIGVFLAYGSSRCALWLGGRSYGVGNDRRLRRWLEEPDTAYVLAVKSNETLWVDAEHGPAQVAARDLAQELPADQWQRLSAGEGSKGPRLYDWGQASIRPGSEPDKPLAAGAPQHCRPPMT